MPVRSLLTATQATTDVTESQDHGNVASYHQKRRMGAGRGLAHLVSKFEILDGTSRSTKPLPSSRTSLVPVAGPTARLTEPPSARSSISTSSLLIPSRSPRKIPESVSQDSTASRNEAHVGLSQGVVETGDKRSSMVAEKRKLFEVNLGDVKSAEPLTYSIDSPSRQNGKHGLLSKWQTVRARSPLACLAQSQAAVLSRPKIPNVSKRLSGYLPLSSTCPSLQSVQNSTKPHRLSACGIHSNKNNNQREVAVPRKTPSTERFETPKPLEAKLALLTPNGDENSLQEQEDPPSRSDSQKSFISKSRNTEPHTPVKSAQAGEDKRQKTVQSPSLGGSQSELLINKTRCKLPLRYRNIRRNLDESRHGPNQPSSSTRPQKDTTVEAAIAQLEATPKQPIPLAPSQIGNAIDHFESLIAGDRIYPKQKHSLRRKFRIPVSRSCQVTKPDSQPKPGVAEETRRKFSNSWGPARWRKGLIGHHTKNGQPEASREPPDVSHGSRRCEGHHIPTDGSADGRHSLSRLWDPRDERLNNLEHESITAVPDLYVNAGSRLEYDAQRLQVGSTDIGCNVTRMEQEHVGIQAGRRSWRFSGRRWMSRSSVPLIARADCTLEQPRPVRVNEIKRLVSLCREKVTGRKTRPQTD